MPDLKVKPGRGWYAVAIAIPILGFVIFGAFLFFNLRHVGDTLQQVIVPGQHELNLAAPGQYTIFHETVTTVGNQAFRSSGDLSGILIQIRSPADGKEIQIMPPGMSQNYSLPGRQGVALFTFSIDHPGKYLLSAQYPPDFSGGPSVLAIGKGFLNKIFLTVFGGLAIVFGFTAIGIAMALFTFLKRRKSRTVLSPGS